jgi:hypothetical protein
VCRYVDVGAYITTLTTVHACMCGGANLLKRKGLCRNVEQTLNCRSCLVYWTICGCDAWMICGSCIIFLSVTYQMNSDKVIIIILDRRC